MEASLRINDGPPRSPRLDHALQDSERRWRVDLCRIYKHLHRYVNEFAFRLNEGDVKIHTIDRLNSFIDCVVGKRLTYAKATA